MQLFFRASQVQLSWHAEMWAHDVPPLMSPSYDRNGGPKYTPYMGRSRPVCCFGFVIRTYIVPNWNPSIPTKVQDFRQHSTSNRSFSFFLSFFLLILRWQELSSLESGRALAYLSFHDQLIESVRSITAPRSTVHSCVLWHLFSRSQCSHLPFKKK